MTASESEGSYGTLLSSFTTSVKADLDSPVTSNFGNRIAEYRSEVCYRIFFKYLSLSIVCISLKKADVVFFKVSF